MDTNERVATYLPWNWRRDISEGVRVVRMLEAGVIAGFCLMSGIECLQEIGLLQLLFAVVVNMAAVPPAKL